MSVTATFVDARFVISAPLCPISSLLLMASLRIPARAHLLLRPRTPTPCPLGPGRRRGLCAWPLRGEGHREEIENGREKGRAREERSAKERREGNREERTEEGKEKGDSEGE